MAPPDSTPTILCIDDEETGLRIRKMMLESEGMRTLTALDGRTGIDLFRKHQVDAVVVDYTMPGMDGAAVARELKQARANLPIIMLSAVESVPPAATHLIDAYVQKGQSPALLLNTIDALLHIRGHAHSEFEGQYVAFVDENRQYIDVTDGVCELLGYSRSELRGMRIDDLTAPDLADQVSPLFDQYLEQKGLQGEFVLLAKNGERVPIRYSSRVFNDGCMVARWEPLQQQGARKSA